MRASPGAAQRPRGRPEVKRLRIPEEAIRIEDRWYVLATSARAGEPSRVLKHGDTFALFDRFGDTPRVGSGEHGLYHQGTRFLSCHELRLEGQKPILLYSSVRSDNSALGVGATNPDIAREGRIAILKGTLHVARSSIVRDATCHERIEIVNYGLAPVGFAFSIEFDADYADIFEVRGFERERRGETLDPQVEGQAVTLSYRGLDGVTRRTRLSWSVKPASLCGERAEFEASLEPHARYVLEASIACDPPAEAPEATFAEVYARAAAAYGGARERAGRMCGSNAQFDGWIERSASDLQLLTEGNPEGAYPYAGVPWYSVPFGRDGILTAIEYLWVDASFARGVLRFLAATQAAEERPEQDAEPGKIIHEMRKGELAALGEIPFGRYYGTIDATPLFIVLAGEYYPRTGDAETVRQIWPAIERALEWIDKYGDADGDGFVEYRRRAGKGLANQGWKDSEDAISHADGTLAEGAIALCEVQGYVYQAKIHAARLAQRFGDDRRALILESQAAALRDRFENAFWCEELGMYALALDGEKRPCRVRASNAGHVLWSGIAYPARAERVGAALLEPDMFCGWGVRTLSSGAVRYNPMSYHNGSVWPHDNAIAAMGLARYGMKDAAVKIAAALYDASLYMDLHRLPELFCGFERGAGGEGPTLYPVACSPQAWASAAPFYLMKACLGLSFRPESPRIRLLHPALPPFLERLRLAGVRAGEAAVDILFERHGGEVGVNVVRKSGSVDVSVVL